MKKLFFYILILIAIPTSLAAQDTLKIYYDKNWNEITDKNAAVFYRKAFPDGNNTYAVSDYYINNKIQMTGRYKNVKMKEKQGHFVYYEENGQKLSEGDYLNDKVEGLWSFWFDNGAKKSEGNFVKDRKDGEWSYWNNYGQLTSKEYYRNGEIYLIEGYHENGTLSFKGEYNASGLLVTGIYWNSDGREYFRGRYKYGLRDGEWIRSFGESELKVNYKNGECTGNPFGGMVRKQ